VTQLFIIKDLAMTAWEWGELGVAQGAEGPTCLGSSFRSDLKLKLKLKPNGNFCHLLHLTLENICFLLS